MLDGCVNTPKNVASTVAFRWEENNINFLVHKSLNEFSNAIKLICYQKKIAVVKLIMKSFSFLSFQSSFMHL